MSRSLSPLALMIPLLLIIWGVAVWGSNADAIWIDEWWTTHYIGAAPNNALEGPIAVINRVGGEGSAHENNPVGYYVLLRLWYQVVGASDVALRLFSGLCTLITVALMYQFGRAVGGVRVGLVSAPLLGLSAFFLSYSHEMRMYALAALFGTLMLLAYWRFMHSRIVQTFPRKSKTTPLYWRFMLDSQASRIWGLVLMISGAGLLYTHYSNAFLIGLLGLCHLFVRPRNRRWWQTIGLAIGTVILFSPHLLITVNLLSRFSEKMNKDDLYQSGIWTLPEVLRQAVMGFVNEQPLFLPVILVALIITLRAKLTRPQREGLFLSGALSASGIIALLIMVKAFQTLFHVRYMLVIWPAMALFIALVVTISVQRLTRPIQRALIGAFVAAWIATGLYLGLDIRFHGLTYSHPTFHNTLIEPTRWDLVGDMLHAKARYNDALVVSVGGDVPWTHTGDAEYYAYGQAARLLMLETNDVDTAAFPDFIHGAGRVWMIHNAAQDATEQYQAMESTLAAAGYQSCGSSRDVGGASVMLYSAVPQCCEIPQTGGTPFGDAAVLHATYDASHDGSIAVWQTWEVMRPQNDAYSIALFALDDAGTVVGQRDMPLPPTGVTCILSEFESPVSDPALRLTVYDWATGVRLPVPSSDNNLVPLPVDY